MRLTTTLFIAAVIAAAALAWFVVGRSGSPQVVIPLSTLEGWTIVASDGTDPWVVAARPPDALRRRLTEAASQLAGRALVAPANMAVPLVLRSEFDDSLQGVYGTDSVVRIAREAGIESATFHPLCLARQRVPAGSGRVDVYYVPFDSPAFAQLRVDLTPAQPEHAGIGVYDPGILSPVLIVGTTAQAPGNLLPLHVDATEDCAAPVVGDTAPAGGR